MANPTRQWSASPRQLAALVIAIVALYFLAGVLSRGANLWRLKLQEAQLRATQQALSQQITDLHEQIRYMQSDSYVERAARSVLLWGRPGEKLIILPDDAVLPTPTIVPPRRP